MTTFAVTSNNQVLDSVNYLLSNLSTGNVTGNITVPAGTLVANVATGQITATGNVSTGSNGFSYLNQWINLRYANNATGSSGFSTVPTNSQYFGVYNSNIATPSSNPTEYVWRQVSGGFGTTKTIYYSSFGGRQVQFVAANVAPSSNFVVSVANVAIDLDVITTAAGLPGERGPVVMAAVLTTADPTSASSSTLTGWFSSSRSSLTPPVGTGLTPVVGDTANFTYPTTGVSAAYEYNGSVWVSVIGQVINGNTIVGNSLPGNSIVTQSVDGNKLLDNTVTYVQIATPGIIADNIFGNTITGNKIAANTISGDRILANTITATNIQSATITGNLIAANTITATNIQSATITGNLIAANTVNASSIVANSITSTQISSAYIYAGNIVSFGASIGNNSSSGYWLQYNTGNARFGGNVSIGNSLTIGNNASIGNNLTVSGLITAGNLQSNTVVTTTMVPGAVSVAGSYNTLTTRQQLTPSNSVWYYDTANVSVVTQQVNQPVYLFGTFQNQVLTSQLFTPARQWNLTYDIGLFRKVGTSYTQVGDYQRYILTDQASTVANSPVEVTPFVGYLDIPASIGTYDYVYAMRYVSAANIVIPSFEFETRNILAQLLKR